jgi:hypothetical protein
VSPRGKPIVISSAVIGVTVVVAAGWIGWARIQEEWYLWQLRDSGRYTEESMAAALRLGDLRCSRAVPLLFELVRLHGNLALVEEPIKRMRNSAFAPIVGTLEASRELAFGWPQGLAEATASLNIDQRAQPLLIRALSHRNEHVRAWAALCIQGHQEVVTEAIVLRLRELAASATESEYVRHFAKGAIELIEMK